MSACGGLRRASGACSMKTARNTLFPPFSMSSPPADDDWLVADVHLSSSPSRAAASARAAADACRRALEPAPLGSRASASAASPRRGDCGSPADAPVPPPLPPPAALAAPLRACGGDVPSCVSNVGTLRGGGGGGGGGGAARGRDFESGAARSLALRAGAPADAWAAPFAAAAGRPALAAAGSLFAVGARAGGGGEVATWHCALPRLRDGAGGWVAVPAPSDALVARALRRRWPAAAFVPSTQQVLLHGGEDDAADSDAAAPESPNAGSVGGGGGGGGAPDMLALDAAALRVWFPPACAGKAPPAGLSGHSLTVIRDYAAATGASASAAAAEYVVLFGGVRGRHWLCDTFLLNPRTLRWQQVKTYGKAPTQRAYHAAAALAGGTRLLVFGGSNGSDAFNDVYVLDCGSGASGAATAERWTWTQPPIRGRGACAPKRRRRWRSTRRARAAAPPPSAPPPRHLAPLAAPRPRAGAVASVVGDRFVVLTGGVAPLDPAPAGAAPPLKPDRMRAMLADMAAPPPPAAGDGDGAAAATPSPGGAALASASGRKRRRPAADDAPAAPPAHAYVCADAWVLDTEVWEWLRVAAPPTPAAAAEDAAAAGACARVGHAAVALDADAGAPALALIGGLAAAGAQCALLRLPAELAGAGV
jgi:hypothetical protein